MRGQAAKVHGSLLHSLAEGFSTFEGVWAGFKEREGSVRS